MRSSCDERRRLAGRPRTSGGLAHGPSRRRTSMAKSGQCSSQIRHWLQSSGRASTGFPLVAVEDLLRAELDADPAGLAEVEVQLDRRRIHQSVSTIGRSMPDSLAFSIALRVAGVGVAHDADARVGGQDALQALGHHVGAVGDDDHAGVDRVADAHAAAVVEAHPAGAGRGVEQRVEDRPVGDRVAAVLHAPRSRGSGSRPSPESRWSRPITIGALTLPVRTSSLKIEAGLARARRTRASRCGGQALELHLLAGHLDPAGDHLVVRETPRPGRRR